MEWHQTSPEIYQQNGTWLALQTTVCPFAPFKKQKLTYFTVVSDRSFWARARVVTNRIIRLIPRRVPSIHASSFTLTWTTWTETCVWKQAHINMLESYSYQQSLFATLVSWAQPYCFATNFYFATNIYLWFQQWIFMTEVPLGKSYKQLLKNLNILTKTQPFWDILKTFLNSSREIVYYPIWCKWVIIQ